MGKGKIVESDVNHVINAIVVITRFVQVCVRETRFIQ